MKKVYLENRSINPKTGNQHSKFYRMTQLNSMEFEAEWGAIGRSGRKRVYNMSDWFTILNKKIRGHYEEVTEGVNDFQSTLNEDVLAKLEKLQIRVNARGVKTDVAKVQTMINKYRRFRTLDMEEANTLYTKYSKKNVEERKKRKAKNQAERKIVQGELEDGYIKCVVIENFDSENGWDPEISEDESGTVHVIFPEFPPEDFATDFDEVMKASLGDGADVDWADREYFIIEDVLFDKVVEFFLNFKVDA